MTNDNAPQTFFIIIYGAVVVVEFTTTYAWVKVFSMLTDLIFLAKVQTVLEIRVNLMSVIRG